MELGKKLLLEKEVTPTDTAAHYGSGLLDVFSTPAMIALMEQAAHQLAKSMLPEEQDSVGSEVNIKHIKATPLGGKVYSVAELIQVDGKKLTFKVEAFDQEGQIGLGTHSRYIIDPKKFIERIT